MLSAAKVPWHSHTEHQRHIIRLVRSEDSGRDRDGDGYTAHQSLDVLINCEDLTVNAKYCSMLVMIYDMFVMWRCHCTILLLVSSTQFVV